MSLNYTNYLKKGASQALSVIGIPPWSLCAFKEAPLRMIQIKQKIHFFLYITLMNSQHSIYSAALLGSSIRFPQLLILLLLSGHSFRFIFNE